MKMKIYKRVTGLNKKFLFSLFFFFKYENRWPERKQTDVSLKIIGSF